MTGADLSLADREKEARIAHFEALAEKNRHETAQWQRQYEAEEASPERARVYHFNAEVNRGSVSQCIADVDLWSRRDPEEDITFVFCSPGGNVIQGLALYDFMLELRRRDHKVITHCYGLAASMGGVLLQGGSERVMEPNSWLMIHEPSRSSFFDESTASELKDEAELYERMWHQLCDILAERSTISGNDIRTEDRAKRRNWWLRATEALELGFVDRISATP